MISLTRLQGARFVLNPDLIERVEATPDTVVTLVTGSRLVVAETVDEVVDAFLEQRAVVLARAGARWGLPEHEPGLDAPLAAPHDGVPPVRRNAKARGHLRPVLPDGPTAPPKGAAR
jgi:flagellar protein FlbD